jgi:predicted TIM-barrel enzyme
MKQSKDNSSSDKGARAMVEQVSEQVKEEEQKSVGLNIRLAPVNNSDQPILANFTRLNGAPGMVFVDFGFLEPAALSALSRLAQAGGKIPENLNGKLAVRVALGYDTLAALHQQLGQVIGGLKAQQSQKLAPAKKDAR